MLSEVGFDEVRPNHPVTISSWALDFAQQQGVRVKDNKAYGAKCYDPGYTFVEKLQTIATKFRRQQETGKMPADFIRHYYGVACLLKNDDVQKFIGSEEYEKHKKKKFPAKDHRVAVLEQEAFILKGGLTRRQYEQQYKKTEALYYRGQIPFDEILGILSENLDKL